MALNVKNLEGNENSDDYTRKVTEQGRWGLTWDVFKGNFGKVVLINLFVLIFLLPMVAVLIVRGVYINGLGLQYPFNSNTGVGYPAYPDTQGLTESIYLSADILFYSVLAACSLIAAVGISGGAYSMKKLVNTQGQFTLKGFFHGVRVCYLNTVLPLIIFMAFLFSAVLVGDWKDLVIARGGSGAGPITAYVFIIIATVLAGIYCAWLLAVGVSYKLSVFQVFRNAFVLMLGSPMHTLFFAAFALIPLWIYLIGTAVSFMLFVSFILLILFGLAFILLIWMSYTQWVFDLYVTPIQKKAEEEANRKKTPKELAAEKEEEEKRVARELLAAGKSELIGKPILPISESLVVAPLGLTYTRADVSRLAADKEQLGKDISAYEEAHKNDTVYAEYNKLFAEREKALQPNDKKSKKKKVSANNLLK